ncbi:hypothetical protein IFR04_004802 [Cadophora malorum]|uniref:Heterokaryon incompatibility domain-containing protein n=1 Tax=Cadophora malorum TaxID=108018 RepID=A0A8H8BRG1_9HELO|nr:hypothetical protein IFR04_004802 [Cadophora malorum]
MDDIQHDLQEGQHQLLSGVEDTSQPLLSSDESITQLGSKLRDSIIRARDTDLSELEAYIYDPIQPKTQIRILTLHPRAGDEAISCSLEVARLDEPPPYEALSYAWGDSKERYPIRCGNGSLEVTDSLLAALRRLRDVSAERVLWIDAICINQQDDMEKGHQVQQMAEIYSQATRVLIWLGEETKSVPAAFEAIRWTRTLFPDGAAYATVVNMTTENFQLYENRNREYLVSGEMMRIILMWRPVFELVSRPWFMRKWVIQEVVRGQHGLIVCGFHTLPWNVFEDTFAYLNILGMIRSWVSTIPYEVANILDTVGNISLMRSADAPKQFMTLATLVRHTRRLLATDPRDHIISMVHLATDLGAEDVDFLIDYKISTITEYLQSFMQWSVQTKRTLVFFSSGFDQADVADPTQPSWNFDVKSWDRVNRFDRFTVEFRAAAQSGMNSPIEATFDSDTHSMSITGAVIDEIAVLGKTFSLQANGSFEYVKDGDEIGKVAVDFAKTNSFQEFLLECQVIATEDANVLGAPGFPAFCNVLTWESCKYSIIFREKSQEYIGSQISKILSHTNANTGKEIELSQEDYTYIDLTVSNYLALHSLGRRFSRTTKGRLGSMPKYAEVGDKICLFYGGNLPYVIRPRGDGTYRYIGDCYLDGVMYGEAMVDGRKSEVFTLV